MKRIHSKRYIWLLAALALVGCAAQAAPADHEQLKSDVVIDGVNVSGMTFGEARVALRTAAESELGGMVITLTLPRSEISYSALELSANRDIEASLLRAASLPRKGGERNLSSPLVIDRAALRATLTAYAEESAAAPSDAYAVVDASAAVPVTYCAEQCGVMVDADALYATVVDTLVAGKSARIDTPHVLSYPNVTLDSLQRDTALVAQFTTSFADPPHNAKNRVYNIRLAAEHINGIILQPGEEFDCNAVLGDRCEENGWREAAGIRNGKYEQEYGGGVCKVSSTLFNAVMMADLEVTERHPHSWPMGYVDIGRDATISTGGKNFRFVNSTDSSIQVFVHVDEEAGVVTASLYGRPLSDCAYIRVVSEKTGTIEAAGESVMLDETLPYQTRVVEREPRDGKTAVTYKEYYAADDTLLRRELVYEDSYRAIDGVTYVSTDLFYS